MYFLKKKKKVYPLIRKKEKIYNLVAERTGKIEKIHNNVNFQNLVYQFKGPSKNVDFVDITDAASLFNDKRSKKIRFEDADKNQMKF